MTGEDHFCITFDLVITLCRGASFSNKIKSTEPFRILNYHESYCKNTKI